MSELTCCLDCGMPVWPNEYHPFAACLMFRGCQNSAVVRANLPDIRPVDATAAPVVVGEDMVDRALEAMWNEEIVQFGEEKTPNNGARRTVMRAALTGALAVD